MERNSYKKLTHEDKFERRYWVDNRAKRLWIKWTKRRNNKFLRRKFKELIKEET